MERRTCHAPGACGAAGRRAARARPLCYWAWALRGQLPASAAPARTSCASKRSATAPLSALPRPGCRCLTPAEFRQVTADPARLEQIARAGGGHVLASPAAAFADDLPPVTSAAATAAHSSCSSRHACCRSTSALRRVRISPDDLWEWVRHPHRVAIETPFGRRTEGWQPAAWMPGAWAPRRPPPRPASARPAETYGHASPGLARAEADSEEDDALSATRSGWPPAARRRATAANALRLPRASPRTLARPLGALGLLPRSQLFPSPGRPVAPGSRRARAHR